MATCVNGVSPAFLPWTNVTVTSNQHTVSRGFEIAIGSPPQIVSLRPSTSDNNLYVVNAATCSPSYNGTCIGNYGGIFSPNESTSFLQTTEGRWNGTADTSSLSRIYFNDDVSAGNISIDGFPVFLNQPGYGGQGVLPLGWKSDFLKLAMDSESIPSTAFGFWTGSRSVNNPVDGSLVLGGYDDSRFFGNLTDFPAYEKCPMCTTVTGLSYDTAQGSTSLFVNSSQTLQIGLSPADRNIWVTQDIYDIFTNISGGVYDPDLETLKYPVSNPPTGNITVTLKNGFKTTIPAEEMFQLPRKYDSDGRYSVSNNTYLVPRMYNQSNDGYVLDWGIPFLTMNYIIGDYARAKFQMAPAIRTNFNNQGGGYQLQAICAPSVSATASGTPPGQTSTASPTASPSPTVAPSGSGGSKSNVGAIVGGVVGGVLGLILIVGGLGFLFWRSRRRHRQQKQLQQQQQMQQNQYPQGPAQQAHGPASQGVPQSQVGHGDGSVGYTERMSYATATSPTVMSPNANEMWTGYDKGPHASVNQWLSSTENESNASHTNSHSHTNMGSSMDRPFEMPATEMPATRTSYDHRR